MAISSISIYKSFYTQNSTEDINEILECNMEDDVCALKASERTRFINDLTARSYEINESTGWTVATINFPAFSDRTESEQEKIFNDIKKSRATTLIIWLASRQERININEIARIFKNLSFENLHIKFYARPINMLEVFDTISWTARENMDFTLEVINVFQPKDIDLDAAIYAYKKMIERNNGKILTQSFSLTFTPMFYDFWEIDRLILMKEEYTVFQKFPTRNLRIIGIPNTYTGMTHDEQEFRKWRIADFFQQSTIPFIEISNIAKTENDKISFIWF